MTTNFVADVTDRLSAGTQITDSLPYPLPQHRYKL